MNRFTAGGRERGSLKLPMLASFLAIMLMLVVQPATAQTGEACASCHEPQATEFSATAHGRYFAGQSDAIRGNCESCHGAGNPHIEAGGDTSLIINPARMDELDGSAPCLSCHGGHRLDNWALSAHNGAGVSCADCHVVHQSADRSEALGQELCYGCHPNVKAASFMPSRHPIGAGRLSCQDCHGVHGEPARLTQDDSGRELCFSCHADKGGPFVYEHPPVTEDCLMCHNAHGSVADNLLKQNEPTLCLNCHPMHFHATVESADGAFSTPQAPERAGVSDRDSFKRGMTTKCTQCHTEIHGGDLPSQAISTGGAGLTR
jgi:DmsE family decaheme c-type cytochrome